MRDQNATDDSVKMRIFRIGEMAPRPMKILTYGKKSGLLKRYRQGHSKDNNSRLACSEYLYQQARETSGTHRKERKLWAICGGYREIATVGIGLK
nr:hypothetical protein [uncultured Cohaesibacter sp.]